MFQLLHTMKSTCLISTGAVAFISAGIMTPSSYHTAQAAGFFVQEVSSSGQGTSYAGQAATSRDASVLFHNPAGLTHLDGAQVNAAIHNIFTHTELQDEGSTVNGTPLGNAAGPFAAFAAFTDDGGNPGGFTPVPNLYAATPLDDEQRLWAGIGVAAPFGLGVQYDDNFFGSFTARRVDLKTIDFIPTLSYQVNDWLSVGASAIVQYADINLQINLPDTSLLRVNADDLAYGYKFGVSLTPNDALTIGAAYRSKINQDFEGDIDPSTINGNTDSAGFGTLNLPDIANFAVAYDIDDKWTILGGVDWYGWSATDTVTITPDVVGGTPVTLNFAYENTVNVNLGAEYKYSDTLTLRAGYQYDETPTTIEGRSAVNPDGDRHWFSGGGTYKYSEKINLDFGLTYIDIEDANINQTRAAGPVTVNVLGEGTKSYAVIGTVGINYKF